MRGAVPYTARDVLSSLFASYRSTSKAISSGSLSTNSSAATTISLEHWRLLRVNGPTQTDAA
jgi:hypothetical protein